MRGSAPRIGKWNHSSALRTTSRLDPSRWWGKSNTRWHQAPFALPSDPKGHHVFHKVGDTVVGLQVWHLQLCWERLCLHYFHEAFSMPPKRVLFPFYISIKCSSICVKQSWIAWSDHSLYSAWSCSALRAVGAFPKGDGSKGVVLSSASRFANSSERNTTFSCSAFKASGVNSTEV